MMQLDRKAFGVARAGVWAAFASTMLGCLAQVDGDYQGEPLATIHGTIAASGGALEEDRPVSAAIMWYFQEAAAPYAGKFVGSRVAVRGSFPANFTLDLYTPPPAGAQLTIEPAVANESMPPGTPLGVWQGVLVAIDERASDSDVEMTDIIGVDLDHVLIYIDRDVKPFVEFTTESALEVFRDEAVRPYAVDMTAGFHLARMSEEYQAATRRFNDCRWEPTCRHLISDDGSQQEIADPSQQEMADWDYKRCTERFPQNPTCTVYGDSSANEPASSVECKDTWAETHRDGCRLEYSEMFVDNPAGLSDPSTISIGAGLYDIGT